MFNNDFNKRETTKLYPYNIPVIRVKIIDSLQNEYLMKALSWLQNRANDFFLKFSKTKKYDKKGFIF